jgi:hypothetical protein
MGANIQFFGKYKRFTLISLISGAVNDLSNNALWQKGMISHFPFIYEAKRVFYLRRMTHYLNRNEHLINPVHLPNLLN